MKKDKRKVFLEELSETPIVAIVCKRVGLSRQTIYRWCAEDKAFKEKFDGCIGRGRDSINDLAESKLISLINEGKLGAIKYWLGNNKQNYGHPKSPYYDDVISSELDRNKDLLRELADREALKEKSGLSDYDIAKIRYDSYFGEKANVLAEEIKGKMKKTKTDNDSTPES